MKKTAFLFLLFCIAAPAFAGTMSTFMGNEARTGALNDVYFQGFDPAPAWVRNVFCSFKSSPVTYRGYVYVCGIDGSVWCLNAASGEDVWQYSCEGPVIATPAVSSGTVVVACSDGNVHGFRYAGFAGENDEPLWTFNTESYLSSSPLILGSTVYILKGYPGTEIVALDLENKGAKVGTFDVSSFGFSSISSDGTLLVAGTNDGTWQCFDKDTPGGAPLWTFQCDSSMRYATCGIYGGRVYIPGCGETSKVYCLDLVTGDPIPGWQTPELDTYLSPDGKNTYTIASGIAVDENAMYLNYGYYDTAAAGDLSKVVCLDRADGHIIWVSSSTGALPKGEQISSPVRSGDYVYVGAGDGSLCVLDGEGDIVTKLQVSQEPISSVLNLSNGRLYVGSDKFYCFRTTSTVHIAQPYENEVVDQAVTVSGTVLHEGLQEYSLEYGKEGEVFRHLLSSGTQALDNAAINVWDTSALDDGAYQLELKARIASNPSPYRAVSRVIVDNPPLPPSGLAAVDTPGSGGSITLTWTKSADDGTGNLDVTGYRVYKGMASGALSPFVLVPAGTILYPDTACTDGTTYYYALTAVDVNGESAASAEVHAYSVDDSASPGGGPLPPSNLAAADTPDDAGGSLTLTWSLSPDDGAGAGSAVGYNLYKSTYAGGFTARVTQLNAGTTFYADTGCPLYTSYYYVLTAMDIQQRESVYSNVAGAYSEMNGVEITPEAGGTVSLNVNGALTEVIIEPGTFETTVRVTIRIPAAYSDDVPGSARTTSSVREFTVFPADARFLKPVLLKIPYSTLETLSMRPENLRIYWWDEKKSAWKIVNTSDPHVTESRVWAQVPHFSFYRVMEYVPGSEDLLNGANVYTYPNPAKGDKVTFKYYVGDKADIAVDVYNVAGELIAHLEKRDNPAGIVSELEWNVSGIASGVYIYVMEARSSSKSMRVKKKLAIIH